MVGFRVRGWEGELSGIVSPSLGQRRVSLRQDLSGNQGSPFLTNRSPAPLPPQHMTTIPLPLPREPLTSSGGNSHLAADGLRV